MRQNANFCRTSRSWEGRQMAGKRTGEVHRGSAPGKYEVKTVENAPRLEVLQRVRSYGNDKSTLRGSCNFNEGESDARTDDRSPKETAESEEKAKEEQTKSEHKKRTFSLSCEAEVHP